MPIAKLTQAGRGHLGFEPLDVLRIMRFADVRCVSIVAHALLDR
jgi:hypothetical protein